MKYRIVLSSKAEKALISYVDFIAKQQRMPQTAERWFRKAWKAVQSLEEFPHRCPAAPEDQYCEFTVRMRLVDECMFLYRVDESQKTVRVIGFRHARQKPEAI